MVPVLSLHNEKAFDAARPRTKLLFDSDNARLVLFCLEPGQRVEPHETKSEVMMQVIEGSGRFQVGAEEFEVREGDLAIAASEEPHGMAASASSRLVVLAVIAPRPE